MKKPSPKATVPAATSAIDDIPSPAKVAIAKAAPEKPDASPPRPHRRARPGGKYIDDGRLKDVLALIQFLALAEQGRAGDTRLTKELDIPETAERWTDVANQHLEFFRVTGDGPRAMACLSVRWLGGKAKGKGGNRGSRDPLTIDQVQECVRTAVGLHAEQVNNERLKADRDRFRLTFWASIASSVVAIVATIATLVTVLLHQ